MHTTLTGTIPILTSVGAADTGLSAFHAALVALGLGHYNLIRLSSVVPPGIVIDGSGSSAVPAGGWGDRLYCVYGEQRATVPGQEAWAGIGWVQRLDAAGGLLVEHEGDSEAAVAAAIDLSLRHMAAASPYDFSEPESVVTGARCVDRPICALVIAPFSITSWGVAAD